MKYAIFSDVHANLQALNAVLADARRMGAETFVSLGDVVGYGPQPAEALACVRKTCAVALAGNHDDAVSGRCNADDFIDLASDAVERHREALDAESLSWLKALPYTAEIDGAVCAHGDLVDPPKFYYVQDEADAGANFMSADFPLAFVGHTHRPAIFLTGQSGTYYKAEPQDFTLEDGKRYIVNVGSVGYPRESNGVCRSSYVLYDSSARTIEFRFLPFAVSSVMQRGRLKRPHKTLARAAALGALLLLATVAALLLSQKPAERILVEAPVKDKTELVLTNLSSSVSAKTREIRANLQLSKDSAPVDLRIRFRDANDHAFPDQTIEVKKSLTRNLIDRNHPLPADACEVELTVLKKKTDDAARIVRFEPVVR